MKYFILLFPYVASVCLTISGRAQPASRGGDVATIRAAAYQAFKAGNYTQGMAQLNPLIQRRSNQTPEDLAWGLQLAAICMSLRNDNASIQANTVAQLAINRLKSPQTRVSAKHSVTALITIGGVHEYGTCDLPQAREAYEAVLTIAPTNKTARERINRLMAIEELARIKSAGNSLLVQRRGTKGQP
jgi:hypothetical protein